jgi:D-3-phosphoglycerate dehydrogenase
MFTNPNKSKVFIGQKVLNATKTLKVICTASTGTNHIDKSYAAKLKLPILSLTEEREVINRISSTAELALSLTLASLRHVVRGHRAVLGGEWNYEKYIGRQMNCLSIGIIGYGRLGSMYSKYCKAFDSRVIVYDPYKEVADKDIEQTSNLEYLLQKSDVIAIHVHVTEETIGMIDKECFDEMKKDVVLVNTARGDMVNEVDLVSFLQSNPDARVATDVLADEIRNREKSPLLKYALESEQVIITPHIGGMCREAQEIAYGHAAKRLAKFFKGKE